MSDSNQFQSPGRAAVPGTGREPDPTQRTSPARVRTVVLTALAVTCFAANSVLARLALVDGASDPTGFSTVRLFSGAVTLWLVIAVRGRSASGKQGGSWMSAWWLFLYALTFAFAYVSLAAGTGALILFAAVQITMIGAGLMSGEKPRPLRWFGLGVAMSGLVVLSMPAVEGPTPEGGVLMAVAGLAWGLYSIRGRGTVDPSAVTAGNFLRTLPMVGLAALVLSQSISMSWTGVVLAVISGALASGAGYLIWYSALRGLSSTMAGIVQLAVPVLAAVGGVFFLGEAVTARVVAAGAAILAGVAIAGSAGDRAATKTTGAL